jgi:hypothetical protein
LVIVIDLWWPASVIDLVLAGGEGGGGSCRVGATSVWGCGASTGMGATTTVGCAASTVCVA